jgi:hypothetical protein
LKKPHARPLLISPSSWKKMRRQSTAMPGAHVVNKIRDWKHKEDMLLDKMKHDPDWVPASESYDPLILLG